MLSEYKVDRYFGCDREKSLFENFGSFLKQHFLGSSVISDNELRAIGKSLQEQNTCKPVLNLKFSVP